MVLNRQNVRPGLPKSLTQPLELVTLGLQVDQSRIGSGDAQHSIQISLSEFLELRHLGQVRRGLATRLLARPQLPTKFAKLAHPFQGGTPRNTV